MAFFEVVSYLHSLLVERFHEIWHRLFSNISRVAQQQTDDAHHHLQYVFISLIIIPFYQPTVRVILRKRVCAITPPSFVPARSPPITPFSPLCLHCVCYVTCVCVCVCSFARTPSQHVDTLLACLQPRQQLHSRGGYKIRHFNVCVWRYGFVYIF